MGSYDYTTVRCPSCRTKIELQSKAGVCMFEQYPASKVPAFIALDLIDNTVRCKACDKEWVIAPRIAVPSTIPLMLVEKDVEPDPDVY